MLMKDFMSVYNSVSEFLKKYSVKELMYVIGEAIDDKKWADAFKKDNDISNVIKDKQMDFFDLIEDLNNKM